MAEAFLKDQLVQASSEIEVFSAGISAKSDESASEEAKKVMQTFNIDLSGHKARLLNNDMVT